MADIDVERKERSIWPWIIGLLLLGLLIWGLAELLDDDDEVAELPVVEEPLVAPVPVPVVTDPVAAAPAMPPPPVETDNTPVPVAVIVGGPASYLGQPVVGTARVGEVVSDRGFWLEQDGQRMFAVIAETPQMENAVNVNSGQTVRIAGVVYDNLTADQVPGGLEADARQIIADQPAFLYVPAQNIILLGPAEG